MKNSASWYRDEYVMVRAVDRAAPFGQLVSLGDPEVVLRQLAGALPSVKTGARVSEVFGKSHTSWEAGFVDERYDLMMEMTLVLDPVDGVLGVHVTVDQGYGRASPGRLFDVDEDGSRREVSRKELPMPPRGYALAQLRALASAVGCSIYTESEQLVE